MAGAGVLAFPPKIGAWEVTVTARVSWPDRGQGQQDFPLGR